MKFRPLLPAVPPVAARTRALLSRRPWLYWLIVATAGLTCWSAVQSALATAEQRADAWGSTRTVWVAVASLHPGDTWDVTEVQYPLAVVPADAAPAAPSGVVGRSIGEGEIVTALDLADASAPEGWVAMALPRIGAPTLVPGDAVVVFGNGIEVCDGRAAAAATATDTDTTEVWLPPTCAATVAAHLHAGTVVLARRH